MEDYYLLSIFPPGEAVKKIETLREELFRRSGMPSARLLPDMIPVARSASYPEPPRENRYRIRIRGGFVLDPVPVIAGEGVFLPLSDTASWKEVRRDPLITQLREPPSGGRHHLLFPYPGVFLGFSKDLQARFSPGSLPRIPTPVDWKKCSLACLRVALVERPGEAEKEFRVEEAFWEYFWEVPVVFRR
ncbi:MAG: hypothetical protein ACLFRY_07010 [Spirochaetia bacterium]